MVTLDDEVHVVQRDGRFYLVNTKWPVKARITAALFDNSMPGVLEREGVCVRITFANAHALYNIDGYDFDSQVYLCGLREGVISD